MATSFFRRVYLRLLAPLLGRPRIRPLVSSAPDGPFRNAGRITASPVPLGNVADAPDPAATVIVLRRLRAVDGATPSKGSLAILLVASGVSSVLAGSLAVAARASTGEVVVAIAGAAFATLSLGAAIITKAPTNTERAHLHIGRRGMTFRAQEEASPAWEATAEEIEVRDLDMAPPLRLGLRIQRRGGPTLILGSARHDGWSFGGSRPARLHRGEDAWTVEQPWKDLIHAAKRMAEARPPKKGRPGNRSRAKQKR